MNFRQATSALPELWTDHMSNSELMGPTNNYYKSFAEVWRLEQLIHQVLNRLGGFVRQELLNLFGGGRQTNH